MYEDRTQNNILNELLEIVPTNANKQEGTIIYAALAAAAQKLEDAYIDIATVYNNSFADTCDREHLIRKCAERGITPTKATHAIYKAVFNCEISIGARFSQGNFNFITIEKITGLQYKLKCESTGTETNNCFGELINLEYNKDFESGSITELLIPAEDEQETEDLREEYFNTIASQEFAGNIAAYVSKVGKIDGVGHCKPIPHANGEGTVKCVIINSEWKSPTDELTEIVQKTVDPETDINNFGSEYGLPVLENYKGLGYGIAPIDHNVLVAGVENVKIDLVTKMEFKEGYTYDLLKEKIKTTLDNYYMSLAKSWKEIANLVVRKSYIESYLLGIEGILDIKDTKINGSETVALEYDKIPIRGEVKIE